MNIKERPVEFYKNPELPVQILQGKWEFEQLLNIYKSHAPKKVLEIGSFFGGTLWHWIKNAKDKTTIVSVDMMVSQEDYRYQEQKESREKWSNWTKDSKIELKTFLGNSISKEAFQFMQENGPYDFIFLDGDHSYDGVKKDWNNTLKLANKNAIIVFHDVLFATWWQSIEVWKLWQEIQEEGYVTQTLCSHREQFFGYTRHSFGIGVVRLLDTNLI